MSFAPEYESKPSCYGYCPRVFYVLSLVIFHLISICSIGVVACFISHRSDWTVLRTFGATMSLMSARYTNFLLDMLARCIVLAVSLLLNCICIQLATARSFSTTGIFARDAVTFYKMSVRIMSLWECLDLRGPYLLRVCALASLASGLGANLASSLIFGYRAVDVGVRARQGVRVWDYTAGLGSNFSGQFIAPNYTTLSSLDHGEDAVLFSGLTAKTMALLDSIPSNASLRPEFSTVAESGEDLVLRNITQVLQTETISTALVGCRPIEPEDGSFALYILNGFVYGAEVNLTSATGSSLLAEQKLYIDQRIITGDKPLDRGYAFVMHTDSFSPPDVPRSKIAIALVERNLCINGQAQTPFGTATPISVTLAPYSNVSLTMIGIVCDLERTRTQYDAVTNRTTSQHYLCAPILNTASTGYSYHPVGVFQDLSGVGALLYSQVRGDQQWRIPNCNSPNPSAPWAIDDSETWARAVQLVEYYDSSLLAASLQLHSSVKLVDVMVSNVSYQLAILPAALLAFGVFLVVLSALLTHLLVFWSWIPREYYELNPLRIVDEVDRYNSIGKRLPANRPQGLTPEELEAELGAKRIAR